MKTASRPANPAPVRRLSNCRRPLSESPDGCPEKGRDDHAGAPSEGAPANDWPVLMEPKPAEIAAELGLSPPQPMAAKPEPELAVDRPAPKLGLEPLALVSDTPSVPRVPTVNAAMPAPDKPAPAPTPKSADQPAAAHAADRMAAKSVFAAKQDARPGSAPRAPFFAVVGVLCVAAAAGAYYVWSQMQPPSPVTAGNQSQGGVTSGVINAPASGTPRPPGAASGSNGPALPAGVPATADTAREPPNAALATPPGPARPFDQSS